MFDEITKDLENRMDKSIESLQHEFGSIRTGRANTSLLENVYVDYYGSASPVTQVATVSVPEPRVILIQPWDKTMIKEIEKSIQQSDLGLSPNSDGNVIRLNIPQLTEERRKEIVKVVHKKTEEARVAVRNIRRDGNDIIKKEEKKEHVSEDLVKQAIDKIQILTDKKIEKIDQLMAEKEKEVLSV